MLPSTRRALNGKGLEIAPRRHSGTFSRTWADAANEDSRGKPFWIDFFKIFGITDKRVAKAKPKRGIKK